MFLLCSCADLCAAQLVCFLPIHFSTWNRRYIMADTLEMFILCLSNVHFIRLYGLVHRGDGKLWDMSFLFWSGFCMVESWACRLSLCLACNPFPGLCAWTWTGRWCASVVATRSLSLFTNPADRCSQFSSLHSWYTTCVSKTLDVVHGYMLC